MLREVIFKVLIHKNIFITPHVTATPNKLGFNQHWNSQWKKWVSAM